MTRILCLLGLMVLWYQTDVVAGAASAGGPLPASANGQIGTNSIKLKMIVGSAQRRLATINDQTFFAGETHEVAVGGRKVTVHCLEIQDKSVTIKAEGEAQPRELGLGEEYSVSNVNVEADPAHASAGSASGRLAWDDLDPEVQRRLRIMSIVSAAIGLVAMILYFPYCWSCRQLCRRAGAPSYIFVWVPVLNRLALFRAAEVSWAWFFLGIPIPIIAVWAWILCCCRLCNTFRRTKWWFLLMIWPVIGWPVFMYLAWASRADEYEPAIIAQDRFRRYSGMNRRQGGELIAG